MKHQKFQKPMDEREKLRKFRELDDAFAEALRELEDPNTRPDIPTGPPVRSLAALEQDEREQDDQARQQAFERRLKALMKEHSLAPESVSDLLQTLHSLGRIG